MYIYKLLCKKDKSFLDIWKASSSDSYSIEWYNEGVVIGEDKLVGKGGDILWNYRDRSIYRS